MGALLAFWAVFVLDYYAAHRIASRGACSAGQWAMRAFLLLAVVAAVAVGGVLTRRSQAARAASGARALPGDILWSRAQCVGVPLLAYGVGAVAGLLGLGGGELMAPLLLALGMLPQVASATSAFMIMFTSSADVVHRDEERVGPGLGSGELRVLPRDRLAEEIGGAVALGRAGGDVQVEDDACAELRV